MEKELGFPKITTAVENYLVDEEGSVPRSKVLLIGSIAIIMGIMFSIDAAAKHSSHKSHSSHSSHSSGSHYSSHSSHVSHQSHTSSVHSSHSSSVHSSSVHSSSVHGNSIHSNTSAGSETITAPSVFKSPYNIAGREGSLLGTHTATLTSGTQKVPNLDVDDIE